MSKQRDFRKALLDASAAIPEGLVDGTGAPAGRRFNVYRNNVVHALTDAMQAGFPVIAKLIGTENFRNVARTYLLANPPTSPLMMHYGQGFCDFLSGFAPLSHLGYLPDVARLELAVRQAYHAADSDPIDPQALAAVPSDDLDRVVLTFAPPVQVIRSDWPLFDIWRFNTATDAPRPQAIAQDVLITRAAFDPAPHPLSPCAGAWVAAAMAGATLGQAQEAASAIDAGFDLGPTLAVLLNESALIGLDVKEDP